jgi:predicted RNase H-related nuclease YkuK (DUF458 family)
MFDKNTDFISPTYGKITFERVAEIIKNYINDDEEYEIAVGTDSMTHEETKFAVAITVHRGHKGGIYFYKTFYHEAFRKNKLFDKLFAEAEISIDIAHKLGDIMKDKGLDVDKTNKKIRFIVHVDVGNYGKTRDYVQALVGMVTSYGYNCEIKPNSYAASSIADRISK